MVLRVIMRSDDDLDMVSYDVFQSLLSYQYPDVDRGNWERKIMLLDSRTNLERELEPGNRRLRHQQTTALLDAYQQLFASEIDFILTPVREGSLGGPGPDFTGRQFTRRQDRFDPHAWDIEQEVAIARMINTLITDANPRKYRKTIQEFREAVVEHYQVFAQPFVDLLNAQLRRLEFSEVVTNNSPVDASFFDDRRREQVIELDLMSRKVEQVVKYPYPTFSGFVYITLFNVWGSKGIDQEFEVVRVIQTKPLLDQIDGLRVDSNCTDGVHNLDSHCDCRQQLEMALYDYGLKNDRNVVIVQMADHEGRGHGTVLKGALQHAPVRRLQLQQPDMAVSHAQVAELVFAQADLPSDMRSYGAAQAVIRFLNIEHVTAVLTSNGDKVKALEAIGVGYRQVIQLETPNAQLTQEARNTLNYKQNGGRVTNADRKPINYSGPDQADTQ